MKFDVVLVGPYNSENIGDIVMLLGFLILFSKVESIKNIFIVTNKDRTHLLSIIFDELKYLDNFDALIKKIKIINYKKLIFLLKPKKIWIFGGGFILLSLILHDKKHLLVLVKYTIIPMLAKLFGNSIIFYSVDGLPGFLARISGILGKVYTRSWVLHKYYNYPLILDIGALYFKYLKNNVYIRKKELSYSPTNEINENLPDLNRYRPYEFYIGLLDKKEIVTYRYHTTLFSLIFNKNFRSIYRNNIDRIRILSLLRAFKTIISSNY